MVPKRVADRFVKTVGKFKQILSIAKDRDVNESDTVAIVKDMLSEIFGYDKYLEITSEFAIRGTFCDIAINPSLQTTEELIPAFGRLEKRSVSQ